MVYALRRGRRWENRPEIDPYLRHVIARNQHETGELLHKINIPTLVLVGSEDRADSDTGNHVVTSEHLRDNIKNAEFAVVEGCGHGFFWQKPRPKRLFANGWIVTDARDEVQRNRTGTLFPSCDSRKHDVPHDLLVSNGLKNPRPSNSAAGAMELR